MIRRQLFWAAFLAAIVGLGFRRAWRWEHGGEVHTLDAETAGKNTHVFIVPTVLFWFLSLFFILFILGFGLSEGFVRYTALMADVLLILSGYNILLMIILPFLRKWFSARVCAVLWLVPAFLCYQGHILIQSIPLPRLTIYIPRTILPVIGTVWLAGFLAVWGYYIVSHNRFSSHILDTATEESDPEILAVWNRELEALEYKLPVRLLRADTPAPFSMGRTKRTRCTVLPQCSYSPEELTMIFQHELHHLQRCDVDTKVFLCLCNALCWFNPLVWIATKKAAEDLELSCDEIVTEEMNEAQRKDYSRLLLKTAAPGRGCTTCLSAAADSLRYRLKGIMNRRKRMSGSWLLSAAVFICVMCYGTVSVSNMRGSFTSLIMTPDVKISKIYDSQNQYVGQWDSTALSEELEKISLDHIAGIRDGVLEGEHIAFLLSDGRLVSVSGNAVFVNDYRQGKNHQDAYLVTNTVDWDAVYACFR